MNVKVKHYCNILVADYPWAHLLEKELIPFVEDQPCKQGKKTNVKANMSNWNIVTPEIERLKKFIKNEIGDCPFITQESVSFDWINFWTAVYSKGDYSQAHDHYPSYWSFVYFLKTKWYHSALHFVESGKKIRPKNGRYVVFPAYLKHKVAPHLFNNKRIVLAVNLTVTCQIYKLEGNLEPDPILEK